MPHCELKFSDDLDFDATAVLARVEEVINAHDPNAHECKGRAYPTSVYHRTHLMVTISLLTKPHRDEAFTRALMEDLETEIKAMLKQSCHFSMLIEYSPAYYLTNEHEVEGDRLPRWGNN